jgi:hypothetical protein
MMPDLHNLSWFGRPFTLKVKRNERNHAPCNIER